MSVLAIDAGSEQSAYVFLNDDGSLVASAKVSNAEMLYALDMGLVMAPPSAVVIEWSAPRGMPASAQFLETVWWGGRFHQIACARIDPARVKRLERLKVKLHLTGSAKAKDTNIHAALIDRYGGTGGKAVAVGVKASQGPLYGVHRDIWAALAVGVTYLDDPSLVMP